MAACSTRVFPRVPRRFRLCKVCHLNRPLSQFCRYPPLQPQSRKTFCRSRDGPFPNLLRAHLCQYRDPPSWDRRQAIAPLLRAAGLRSRTERPSSQPPPPIIARFSKSFLACRTLRGLSSHTRRRKAAFLVMHEVSHPTRRPATIDGPPFMMSRPILSTCPTEQDWK